MKIKCKICDQIFKIPKGSCPICFGDFLGEINDIEDSEERFEKLSDFINELSAFDYNRGFHNAKCNNRLSIGAIGLNWEELEE